MFFFLFLTGYSQPGSSVCGGEGVAKCGAWVGGQVGSDGGHAHYHPRHVHPTTAATPQEQQSCP